jgi:hypothetical protein
MSAMRRALLFALFIVLAVDCTTPDIPVAVAGARASEWDDEEESLPSRRQRSGAEQRTLRVSPPGQRSIDQDQPHRRPEAMAATDRPDRATAWLRPMRQVDSQSPGTAPPSEDH